eukprot:4552066-Ditylum_brightwellii.AAC.1
MDDRSIGGVKCVMGPRWPKKGIVVSTNKTGSTGSMIMQENLGDIGVTIVKSVGGTKACQEGRLPGVIGADREDVDIVIIIICWE